MDLYFDLENTVDQIAVGVGMAQDYLKEKYKSDDGYRGLSFEAVERSFPDVSGRVIILRDRVKELKRNFLTDANDAHRVFVYINIVMFIAGIIILYYGFKIITEKDTSIPTVVIFLGWVSATLAGVVSSFGMHKRYSAMFAAHWAIKSLETSIDQVVHDIVLGLEGRDELNAEELKRLREYMDRWLATYMTILTSFGDKYGSALGPLVTANMPSAKN